MDLYFQPPKRKLKKIVHYFMNMRNELHRSIILFLHNKLSQPNQNCCFYIHLYYF